MASSNLEQNQYWGLDWFLLLHCDNNRTILKCSKERKNEIMHLALILAKIKMRDDDNVPWAAKAPPVMLCVISFRPGFIPSILAGVVCR